MDSKVAHSLRYKPALVIIQFSKVREKRALIWMCGKLGRIWEKIGKEKPKQNILINFELKKGTIINKIN